MKFCTLFLFSHKCIFLSKKHIYGTENKLFVVKFNIFEQHFVDFKKFLTKYVYTSPLAQQMDTKARYIVTKLYESF